MKNVLFVLFLLTAYPAFSQQLFQVSDFTQENLFSTNIEGPNYRDGKLYVVNFGKDGTVGVVNSKGESSLFVELPEGSIANAIQFNSRGEMLLADFKAHNILYINMETKKISVFSHNDLFNQPNDICINKQDQLFASDPNWKEGTGKIWRIDKDGKPVLLKDGLGTTNGIELSPNEKTLYVNESVQKKIWAFDVTESGGLLNQRLFHEFTDFGLDGMKCDAKGNLYVTRYGKGSVVILSPKGKLIKEVFTKGKNTSNIAFGGLSGKTVFVTLQDRKGIEIFEAAEKGKAFKNSLDK
jgi:sugar lactone lactonase YvrE